MFDMFLIQLLRICAWIVDVETGPVFWVLEHPLFFREELQNQQVDEGETAFLHCELSKPGLLVQWKKESVLLRPGKKYKMEQDGCGLQLQIFDLAVQDSGTYSCCVDSTETKASLRVKGILCDEKKDTQNVIFC